MLMIWSTALSGSLESRGWVNEQPAVKEEGDRSIVTLTAGAWESIPYLLSLELATVLQDVLLSMTHS
jgi:hypothetical protein